jgi:two-component system sensor histidine kinase RpfC
MKNKYRNLELEQSFMRLLLVVSGEIYSIFLASTDRIDGGLTNIVVLFGGVYIFFSLAIILQVYLYPSGSKYRHTIYMILDVLLVCFLLIYLGEYGVPFFAVYLWLTVGNGFRYGYKELILCAVMSLSSFVFVVFLSGFWKTNLLFSITGIMLLSVVPLYVAIMLKRLQEAKNNAEKSSIEKSRFLANISHEIRTPLNAIVGFSGMLSKVDDFDEQKRMVTHINNASESLMNLVEGVLDLSRIESGRVRMNDAQTEVRAMMMSVEGMFSLQTGRKGVQYRTHVSETVPQYAYIDQQRVGQVLINLVGNAVKFTDQGCIDVSVATEEMRGNGEMLRFSVRDTGPGIQQEFQRKIFDRFRQVDDSAQRQHGGTGLGTAIARSLVELMGGSIGVDSTYGAGSCFWFTIPLVTCTPEVPDEPECVPDVFREAVYFGGQGGRGDMPLDQSRKKVLIAEDSEINRYVYQNMFRLFEVDVEFAVSGSSALDLIEKKPFCLMILDLQMPGMSGIDVINIYNSVTAIGSRIPIVVITGDATAEMLEECKRLGVSAFIPKPIGVDKMREILGRYNVMEASPAY